VKGAVFIGVDGLRNPGLLMSDFEQRNPKRLEKTEGRNGRRLAIARREMGEAEETIGEVRIVIIVRSS